MNFSAKSPPIIIIGMHRSGTTMITKMLQQLGVFIGWDYNDEFEANFFLRRNERLLNVCSGSWDRPYLIDNLLDNRSSFKVAAKLLVKDLRSFSIFNFLGPLNTLKYKTAYDLDIPWGWKDPRTTFLLPLWLNIFPEAKIIHIYRNGIDIAKSLATRETKRLDRLGKNPYAGLMTNQLNQLKADGPLLYTYRKALNITRKLNPLTKYMKLKIHACISLQHGFELWCDYVERAFSYQSKFANEMLTLKYEDFLLNPEDNLYRLCEFCNIQPESHRVENLSGKINPSRRFAFKEDKALFSFYHEVKENTWMKKLGYQF